MAKDKKSNDNPYYSFMTEYIEFCIRPCKNKLSEKEKEGLSDDEIVSKEEELKANITKFNKKQNECKDTYSNMCSSIEKSGLPELEAYSDAMITLYEEKSDWKKDIKSALVANASLKLYRKFRDDLNGLYPILLKINKVFPIDDYSELSLKSRASLYGSEVNKTQKGSLKNAPLSNDEISRMLDMFCAGDDFKRLGDWIIDILAFDDELIDDAYKKEFVPLRHQLKEQIYNALSSNESYRSAVQKALFDEGMLNKLIDGFCSVNGLKKNIDQLTENAKLLEERLVTENLEHEVRRKEQSEMIKKKDSEIEFLKKYVHDYEHICVQLDNLKRKYNAQIDINESIKIDDKNKIDELNDKIKKLSDEVEMITHELEEMKKNYEALQSDYGLKANELERLKAGSTQRTENARKEVLKDLIFGLNEQLYYLTMFLLELKDTGGLAPETIELFGDTLDNVDKALEKLGIEKIGVVENTTSYDSTLHEC